MKFSLSVVLAAFALQSTALLVPRDALSSDLGSALAPGAGHILPLESRARKGNSKGKGKGKGKGKHTHAHGVRPDFRKPCKSLPSTCPSFLNKKAVSSSPKFDDTTCLEWGVLRLTFSIPPDVRMQGRRNSRCLLGVREGMPKAVSEGKPHSAWPDIG